MKDKIDTLCETLYTSGKNSFEDNKEIANIIFYSLPKKNSQGKILYFCIFSFVFNLFSEQVKLFYSPYIHFP